jgi:hypothetical protein
MTKIFDLNKLIAFSQKNGIINIPQDLVDVKKDVLTTKNFTVSLICLETG